MTKARDEFREYLTEELADLFVRMDVASEEQQEPFMSFFFEGDRCADRHFKEYITAFTAELYSYLKDADETTQQDILEEICRLKEMMSAGAQFAEHLEETYCQLMAK